MRIANQLLKAGLRPLAVVNHAKVTVRYYDPDKCHEAKDIHRECYDYDWEIANRMLCCPHEMWAVTHIAADAGDEAHEEKTVGVLRIEDSPKRNLQTWATLALRPTKVFKCVNRFYRRGQSC